MPSEESQEEINAVLDAALNDLDDDDDDDDTDEVQDFNQQPAQNAAQHEESRSAQPLHTASKSDPSEVGIDEMMMQLLQMGEGGSGDTDEFMGRFLQEMQSHIGAELGNVNGSTSVPSKKRRTEKSSPKAGKTDKSSSERTGKSENNTPSTASDDNNVDQAIASLIEGMSKQAKLDDNIENMDDFTGEDDMFKNLMGQLGGGDGDDVSADALIDGMLEQLLSKDLMYEPMKKVTEKFPAWLETNKGKLPPAEYEQRCKQYECFQKLVHTYDAEPGNTQTLMLLMQEVQEYGQPPAEIIKDIAPGLELDEDGLPKMDGNGGMPFPGGDEDCRIM